MPIGDPLYQLTDLQNRVRILEQTARARAQQTSKADPTSPLTNATSRGQITPGMSADTFSRLGTAIQASLSGVESLQDVITASIIVNFGGGVTQSLVRTNYIRPDPIVGDVYRFFLGGFFQNNTVGAQTIEFRFRISAGTEPSLGTFNIAAGDTRYFWILIYITTLTAGVGVMNLVSRATSSAPIA